MGIHEFEHLHGRREKHYIRTSKKVVEFVLALLALA